MRQAAVRTIALLLLALVLTLGMTANAEKDSKQQAKETRRKIRSIHRSVIEAYNSGLYDSALIRIDSLAHLDSTNKDILYYRAKILLKSADSTQARQILLKAVKDSPRSARNRNLLARIYLAQGLPKEAVDLLDDLLAFKKRESESLYLNGLALLQLGDSTRALDQLEKALKYAIKRENP